VALALGDVDLAEQVLDAVREPIARIGIRDVGADVHHALAACAEARGDLAGAAALLAAGLEVAGSDGFVALRLALRMALARVTGDAVHMEAARALIDEIAASVGDASGLGAGFRGAALEELAAAGAPAPS
jgi:hypothetical protein